MPVTDFLFYKKILFFSSYSIFYFIQKESLYAYIPSILFVWGGIHGCATGCGVVFVFSEDDINDKYIILFKDDIAVHIWNQELDFKKKLHYIFCVTEE